MKKQTNGHPNNFNYIVSSTVIVGDLKTDNDIRIDGKIDGTVQCGGKLVLGETGEIKGEVRSKSATVSGKIFGKIFVDDIINITETAYIEGELTASKLAIEPGAIFKGVCNMPVNERIPEREKK